MKALSVGSRVREPDDTHPDALRAGTGEVTGWTGATVSVRWDNMGYPYVSLRLPSELIVVPITCSYAKVQWKKGKPWGIDGMIVVCDVHGAPAAAEVYEVESGQEGTVTARCQGPW